MGKHSPLRGPHTSCHGAWGPADLKFPPRHSLDGMLTSGGIKVTGLRLALLACLESARCAYGDKDLIIILKTIKMIIKETQRHISDKCSEYVSTYISEQEPTFSKHLGFGSRSGQGAKSSPRMPPRWPHTWTVSLSPSAVTILTR